MLARKFEEQVEKTPGHTAVKTGEQIYTYTRLNRYANRIAHLVKAAGTGDTVGLLLEHGVHMIAALLGSLKVGKIVVPLSVDYPQERLAYMLSHSGSSLILTETRHLSQAMLLAGKQQIPVLDIDPAGPGTSTLPAENPLREVSRDKPAYILYTSGSTGRPKGVVQTHENADYYNRNWVRFFSIGPSDRMTLFSSFCHDGSVQDMYSALHSGAALYPFNMRNPGTDIPLWEFLRREKITIWHSVPSLFSSFTGTLTGSETFPDLRFILLGGEPVREHEVKMFNRYFPLARLANVYGQTESSVNAIHLIEPGSPYQKSLVGTPLDETRVFVIDEEGDPVTPLRSGEILVASPYISPGYWQNPEAGQDTFGEDEELGRLYWTGDLGRLLVDGSIEFLGRRDFQVKIRGFRVELGEIESRLLEDPQVEEAVVTLRKDESGDDALCAYLVARGQGQGPKPPEIDSGEVRKSLAVKLPDYMLPSYFVLLGRMPRTPSGKIDRNALPAPEVQRPRQQYVPPGDEIEHRLVNIWSGVLGVKQELIGMEDDFFRLGGHSLRATIMAAKIHKELGINIPLLQIFKTPRPSDLAGYVKAALAPGKPAYEPIEPVEKREYYPLSSAQRRLYVFQQMDPGNTGYNLSLVMSLEGNLDLERFEGTFRQLLARHESLRTSFQLMGVDTVQRIHDEVEFTIKYYDLFNKKFCGGPGGGFSKEPPGCRRQEEIIKSVIRPFDLSRAPLLRVGLIKNRETGWIFMVDMHHVITDGTSMGILTAEFLALYGGEQLSPLKLCYKDYSQWQNSAAQKKALEKQQDYWLNRFKSEIPVLDLPLDYPRPLVQSFEGRQLTFEIQAEQTRALKALALKEEATLFMVILSLCTVLLAKLSGQEDIVVGTAAAARRHSDLQPVIGMFVNTLALRNFPHGEQSLDRFLETVKESTIAAYENQEYFFEDLVEQLTPVIKRDVSRNPLFDVMLVLQNMETAGGEIPGLTLKPYDLEKKRARFDITLIGFEAGEKLVFICEYGTKLFKEETLQRFVRYFKTILAAAAETPGKKLDEIGIITAEEKKQILVDFNDTKTAYPNDKTLHELFAEQAQGTPDRIALVGSTLPVQPVRSVQPVQPVRLVRPVSLTYRQLNEKSGQLARGLSEKGLGAGTIAAIMVERSLAMIIGILAILKAGAAYLPIDPDYPQERIDFMLKDSHAKIRLTADEIADLSSPSPLHLPPAPATSLAYIMYTSGTTGKPRGVMVEHRNVVRLVIAVDYIRLSDETRILQTGAPVFDATTFETWGSLLHGGQLILVANDVILEADQLAKAAAKYRVTTLWLTSPLFNQLVQQNSDIFSGLEYLLVGGDVLSPPLINKVRSKNPRLKVINGYGPTESTTFSTTYQVDRDFSKSIPIGKPINNSTAFIFNRGGSLQPLGVPGELAVGGDGVSRGYLNDPELTAERFCLRRPGGLFSRKLPPWTPRKSFLLNKSFLDVQKPFFQKRFLVTEGKLYRTGDLARWLPDGNIDFIGRTDHQVKIRGFRIELEEIRHRLLSHAEIHQAVVLLKQEKESGQKYLCAYITAAREVPTVELREYLSRDLPAYMIPAYFVRVEKIPLTPNGKVDVRALPDPGFNVNDAYEAPTNEIEKRLIEVWLEVLPGNSLQDSPAIGINDNFFDLGGDSIKAIQAAARLKKYRLDMKINDLFLHPVIKELAKYVSETRRTTPQGIVQGEVELTPIQQWFFETHRTGSHHFNQAVILYRKEGFKEGLLRELFTQITLHHDALRMVYKTASPGHLPSQENRGTGGTLFHLEIFSFAERDNTSQIQREAASIQGSIDLAQGPLLKAGLFKTPSGDHLLIVIHHLVVDGVSWRILLEDFQTGYHQLEQGKTIRFQEKTDSFQYWARKLNEYARGKEILRELEYWQRLDARADQLEPLPLEAADSQSGEMGDTLNVGLDKQATDDLLRNANRAFNTEINDILLTALGITLKEWAGIQTVCLDLEGHGREPIIDGIDITRTVGWYTSQYPVILEISQPADLSLAIKEVKETLRRIPHKGIGYGILRYLTPPGNKGGYRFKLEPQTSFNYLGQFGQESGAASSQPAGQGDIGISPISPGPTVSPTLERKHLLEINGILAAGQLSLAFNWNRHRFKKASIEQLCGQYRENLLKIIRFCTSRENRELTPSDLGYPHLSLRGLAGLEVWVKGAVAGDAELQRLYPLGPMQSGMFYHSLHSRENQESPDPRHHADSAYVEQCVFTFRGEIEPALLEKSLNRLVQRYDILRTIFVHENLEEPLQVVLKTRPASLAYRDLSTLPAGETRAYLEKFRRQDREKGFDLSKDPLVRAALLKTAAAAYVLVWSFHHILMDGWCLGIIYKEMIRFYGEIKDGRPAGLEAVTPYENYIQWLRQRDKAVGLRYWQEYLEGYERQSGLPFREQGIRQKSRKSPQDRKYLKEEHQWTIPEPETAALNRVAAKHRVTINILCQVLWGLLLQYYNDTHDVVFGAVVSGRPPEIKGIETMIGLFINTIPVRIETRETRTLSQLLKTVQQHALASQSHEYLPLAEIQSCSLLKTNLLDHIMAFENYPLHEEVKKGSAGESTLVPFEIQQVEIHEQTPYDFNIIIVPGTGLKIRLSYNAAVYRAERIKNLSRHLQEIIKQLIANPEILIDRIEIVTAEEKQQLLFEFNRTAVPNAGDKTVLILFAEQVEHSPHHIVLVEEKDQHPPNQKFLGVQNPFFKKGFGRRRHTGGHLSYRQLQEKSLQLAQRLREKGVQPDTLVGIMLEPCLEMVIGILGILFAGGAYLPIDPQIPQERIDFMLKDSSAKLLLTRQEITSYSSLRGASSHLQPAPATSLAYIIYTSGTTGRPKGTLIQHDSLVNLCCWHNRCFDVTAADKATRYAGAGFDASVWELFPYLIAGASIYMVAEEIKSDPHRLNQFFETCQITIAFLPTQVCELFMTLVNRSLRILLTGGDKLRSYLEKNYRVVNNYGPTENTVVSTSYFVSAETMNIPIGKPIDNTQVIILNRHGQLQPVGVPGELCVSGTGLARGYLNQPELTVERFCLRRPGGLFSRKPPPWTPRKSFLLNKSFLEVQKPFFQKRFLVTEGRIYGTGDLARWLWEGNLEFLGRIDSQVKIRGFRIETGEIEKQLLKHQDIKDAAVIAGEKEDGDRYLCAYVVPGKSIDPAGLRAFLSRALPEYMVPAYFVPLETMPLTPNGKLDRNALPAPGPRKDPESAAPRDEIEKELAAIWSEVLNIPNIGIDDHFFELGGHSLKATLLATKIHKTLGIKIPLAEIFNAPLLKEMAKFLRAAKREKYTPIDPAEQKEYYPLSSAQGRFYILQQVTPASTAYNMTQIHWLAGDVAKEKLAETLKKLIRRHETLRTSFRLVKGQPAQVVHEKVEFKIEFYNLATGDTGEDERKRGREDDKGPSFHAFPKSQELRAKSYIKNFLRPFDLSLAPLLRLGLVQWAEEKMILMFDMHHIISDGGSMSVFLKEFMSLYAGREAAPLPLQYKDFAQWQYQRLKSGKLKQQQGYWQERFRDELPILDIVPDFPRPPIQRFEGDRINFTLDAPGTSALNHLLQETGTTLFMGLLAVFNLLLARYSGQEDIVLGTTIAGRSHPDLEQLIGLLIETLALRNQPRGQLTFLEFLKEIKQTTLDAYANQDYPFKELIKKLGAENELSRNPVFDAMLIIQNLDMTALQLEGLEFSSFQLPGAETPHMSKVDFTLEAAESAGMIYFRLEYCTCLYKHETMERIARHFINIIKEAVHHPAQRLAAFQVIDPEEKRQLLEVFNTQAGQAGESNPEPVLQRFADQAARTPDNTALIGTALCGGPAPGDRPTLSVQPVQPVQPVRQVNLTYGELNEKSGQLARGLSEKGPGPGTIVPIMVEPSLEMVIGILGILKAGAAYLPIEPGWPAERIKYILADSRAKVLITTGTLVEESEKVRRWEGEICYIEEFLYSSHPPTLLPSYLQRSANLAYIIYTSGSTGRPKGVLVEQKNLSFYMKAFAGEFDLQPEDTVIQQASYAFDAFVEELYPILLRGGKLVIAGKEILQDIPGFVDFLIRHRVTFITCSPQLLSELNTAARRLSSLRIWISGGDRLKPEDIGTLRGVGEVYNTYGPTEATVCATYYRCPARQPLSSDIPIGKPITHYRVYILDRYLQLLPIGVAGELCIAGGGVTRGYLNRPELTMEKFVFYRSYKSYKTYISKKLYKSGDLARWHPDGNIEFLGRLDRQVKIRGYRIELGEIENRLAAVAGIIEAAVVEGVRTSGQNYLAAYVVSREPLDLAKVKSRLAQQLPAYMIPPYIMEIASIPRTSSGKVDSKRLPRPEASTAHPPALPGSRMEQLVADIWKEVLEIHRVGVDDHFFDLGGTSLDIFKVNTRLNEVFNRQIPVVALFRYSTVRSLVRFLEAGESEAGIAAEKQQELSNALAKGKATLEKLAGKTQGSRDETGETSGNKHRSGLEVAVIGMAGTFPGSPDIHEFWENVKEGREGISFFTDEELQAEGIPDETLENPNYIKARGLIAEVEYFDEAFFAYTPLEAQLLDPQIRIFAQCLWHALEDAGYDPYAYERPIGLYAGASPNLQWEALTLFSEANRGLNSFMAAQLIDKDFMCTHISYKLNLKGPSYSLQTACSTSLVAIHWAVRGLLGGECQLALAGGISINYLPKKGYRYQPGMIFSADGHHRPFAAEASGSVFSDGAGAVVLKRLEDAQADKDHIYAIIKGTATNNDGFRKVGYTAPSVEAQAEVIKAAHLMAGVEPESISYIETHGTATPLGDTVEIEALKQAFGSNKKGFCAVGTVKSNVGHLYSAAGVTGFIKTALALEHRLLPPTLHFNSPNPQIDFDNSPFYVNTRLKAWNAQGHPLRAGVSAFGIGGTNVHAVLEEAPVISPRRPGGLFSRKPPPWTPRKSFLLDTTSPSRAYQLILLSAKKPGDLDMMTRNLLAFLEKNLARPGDTENPGLNLADLAYTLQVGRKHFPYRRMLLTSTLDSSPEKLALYINRIPTALAPEENPPVVFMFCGQGSQYVDMGIDLYHSEPFFAQELNRCFEILEPLMEIHLKEILYLPRDNNRSDKSNRSYNSDNSIHQTEITQPVVFAFEYALASLLMHWGIKPQAMIGYSFGEYIAACIAGVFSLEDALKLITTRGQLTRQTPDGAMTSVPLREHELKPLLSNDLSLAIVNGPTCIVSGPLAAVTAFEQEMKKRRTLCVRLNMSQAIHSGLMTPIRREFQKSLGEIPLHPPQIPYISNVTAQWLTGAEAVDPVYWGNHLCSTVRFSDGLTELLKLENAIFIEIGAGRVLGMMVRTHPDKKPGHLVLNTVKHQQEKVPDDYFLLDKIGQLWLHGQRLDWQAFYQNQARQRVSLPGYPFAGKRYWLDSSSINFGQGVPSISLAPGETVAEEAAVVSIPGGPPGSETAAENPPDPGNEQEQAIARLWQELLGIQRIGKHDDFFYLNGSSLVAMQLIARLTDRYQVEIPMNRFYEKPTIAHLAEVIQELTRVSHRES